MALRTNFAKALVSAASNGRDVQSSSSPRHPNSDEEPDGSSSIVSPELRVRGDSNWR